LTEYIYSINILLISHSNLTKPLYPKLLYYMRKDG